MIASCLPHVETRDTLDPRLRAERGQMREQQVFAKCAWRLIPLMALLFLLNFIDRTNVGFAALTMNRDLGFSPEVFGFGAGILFLGYGLFQVPANVMLDHMGARRWIFLITALWGLISASNALVNDPVTFYLLRFALGVVEAGLFPGMVFYLTLWFPQAYRGRFTAMFATAVPLSGIVGGPLSGFILEMDGLAGLYGWQWLFLIEGLPVVLIAFVVLNVLPDSPKTASWLSPAEKNVIASHLATEGTAAKSDLWGALLDPRVYVLGIISFLGLACGLYGTTLWLPQIVQAMGFANLTTSFIVVVPYFAGMLAMIFWGHSSDIRGERVWHVALAMLLAAAGLGLASVAPNYLLVLLAITVAMMGLLAVYGPFYSLISSFLGGSAAAGGIALVNTIASLGGFLGPYILGALREATGDYAAGMITIALGLVLAALMVLALARTIPKATPGAAHAGKAA